MRFWLDLEDSLGHLSAVWANPASRPVLAVVAFVATGVLVIHTLAAL
jgi:hypothetical protein